MTVVSVLEYILDFCTLDEGLRMREGGGNFYGNEIGAGWRHGVFKWTRLGDIGLCSVTDTGCHEDQQLPHRHYWGGREGGRFLSSSTPLYIRMSHGALTKDLSTPQFLSKKLLRPDMIRGLSSQGSVDRQKREIGQAFPHPDHPDHHDLQSHHSDHQSNHADHCGHHNPHDHHDLHDD